MKKPFQSIYSFVNVTYSTETRLKKKGWVVIYIYVYIVADQIKS